MAFYQLENCQLVRLLGAGRVAVRVRGRSDRHHRQGLRCQPPQRSVLQRSPSDGQHATTGIALQLQGTLRGGRRTPPPRRDAPRTASPTSPDCGNLQLDED